MNAVKDFVIKTVTIHQEAINVIVTEDTFWTVTTEPVQVRLCSLYSLELAYSHHTQLVKYDTAFTKYLTLFGISGSLIF